MTLFGYNIELTWNLFWVSVLIPGLGWYLKNLYKKGDQLQEERHSNLVNAIEDSKVAFMKKLDSHCATQEKLHKQIDERFWKHGHHGDDIVIKGGGI